MGWIGARVDFFAPCPNAQSMGSRSLSCMQYVMWGWSYPFGDTALTHWIPHYATARDNNHVYHSGIT